jgi:O-methyltransferase involved in polyketide biosynthesis
MTEIDHPSLDGAAETLLITLYMRALESQRTDALIRDEKAVEILKQMDYAFRRVRRIPLTEANKLVIILRNREFDRYTVDFLGRHPDGVVVHIGCGLDTRFERLCSEKPGYEGVEWYDLDFPEVIELRRKLFGDAGGRYHMLACSALDYAWLEAVNVHRGRPFLFVAEGVSMHLYEKQVKSLVLTLLDHFPGSELVFDAYSPFHLRVSNLQTARAGIRCHWGLWRGQEIEGWAQAGEIRLLDEWGYFDCNEPRLASSAWIRPLDRLVKPLRIYHFQLGEAAG